MKENLLAHTIGVLLAPASEPLPEPLDLIGSMRRVLDEIREIDEHPQPFVWCKRWGDPPPGVDVVYVDEVPLR